LDKEGFAVPFAYEEAMSVGSLLFSTPRQALTELWWNSGFMLSQEIRDKDGITAAVRDAEG
jgi:hypothetical protein